MFATLPTAPTTLNAPFPKNYAPYPKSFTPSRAF
jgi:hypothetical protein